MSHGEDETMSNIFSYESNAVWLLANFQLMTGAIAFSVGPPFRKHIYTNILFLLCLIGFTACFLSYLFVPGYLGKMPQPLDDDG